MVVNKNAAKQRPLQSKKYVNLFKRSGGGGEKKKWQTTCSVLDLCCPRTPVFLSYTSPALPCYKQKTDYKFSNYQKMPVEISYLKKKSELRKIRLQACLMHLVFHSVIIG